MNRRLETGDYACATIRGVRRHLKIIGQHWQPRRNADARRVLHVMDIHTRERFAVRPPRRFRRATPDERPAPAVEATPRVQARPAQPLLF